jgi:Zn-dependent protease
MFYEIDSTRATLEEYRWGTPLILMPLAILAKVLRIRMPGFSDDPNVDLLQPFRVPRESLPQEVQTQFAPLEDQLRACGFVDPVYYAIHDPLTQTRICQATYRHTSGQTLAKLQHRRWSQPNRPREALFAVFITSFADDTFLVSSSGKPDMLAPPSYRLNRLVGAAVPELWRSHSQELSLYGSGKTILPAYSQEELVASNERHHAAVRDFHVARGVFQPSNLPAVVPLGSPMVDPSLVQDVATHATLAEIARLQNRKAGWLGNILILAVTVGLFVAAGHGWGDWQWLMLLVAVLFFHELGHFAAMWLFRYRNLRMFFIPFLGAAVTGQNYNVPGWKKVIVSLMGPVPGILLGIGLGFAALVGDHAVLLQTAVLLLVINTFNLLPILPFDGGWVMHAVLFSRHPVLDVAFRAAAAGLLILLGFAAGGWLAVIGGVMLMSLRTSYRLAEVVRRLRQRGLNAVSPDAQTIPPEAAVAIVGELRASFPSNIGSKNMARFTLQVFESLNARPPDWPASLAFIVFHGGAFFVGLVFCALFTVAQHGGLREFLQTAANPPKHSLDSAAVLSWRGPEADQAAGAGTSTIVADFASRSKAEDAYRKLTVQLPPQAAVTLFGQTLLIALPANDDVACQRWLGEVKRICPQTSLDSAEAGCPFTLTCIARDTEEAKAIADDAEQYFKIPAMVCPIPPWSKEHALSPKHRKARRTFLEIQNRRVAQYDHPQIASLRERIVKAAERQDREALVRLSQKRYELTVQLQREALEKMRQEGPAHWDLELVDLYLHAPGPQAAEFLDDAQLEEQFDAETVAADFEKYQEWAIELGARLGQLPLADGVPVGGVDRYACRCGTVSRAGLLVRFAGVNFARASDGAPALADWLAGKGCVDLKYEFRLRRAF